MKEIVTQGKNIIIGCAVGYDWDLLWPFVVSCSKNNKIILLVGHGISNRGIEMLNKYNVEMIFCSYDNNHLCLPENFALPHRWNKPMKMVCSRFLAIWKILKVYEKSINYVLITDTRDVICFGDIFDFDWHPTRVNLFCEHGEMIIRNCVYNYSALRKAYGKVFAYLMKNRKIICSGSILGQVESVLAFLEAMLDQFLKIDTLCDGITDQAVTNFLSWKKSSLYREWDNEESPLYNWGHVPAGKLNLENKIMHHQYDRSQHSQIASELLKKISEAD